MLDFLRCGINLLLALLGATAKAQHKMEGGLLLNVIIRQCAAIFKLLPSKNQSLLVRWNALLV